MSNTCYMLETLGPVAFAALTVTQAAAQTATPQIPWVDTPPQLEAIAAGRTEAMTVTGFRQREPNDGDAITETTTAYLSRDARHLYVAFRCEDRAPDQIRARLSRRDGILQDDEVLLLLDTFHDRRRAYLFAANPLGVQADAIVAEGKDDDYSFDAVWRSEGRLTPTGFVVLFIIPFKSLRLPADGDGIWGVALARVLPRNSEGSFWPYVTRRTEGLVQQFAPVGGFTRAEGGRNLQLIPYAAADAGRFLDRDDSREHTVREQRAGLDAKLVIRDATAVDLAVNPDFSQIESDQPQVSINQRFEVFYPEKRPFFLENSTLFRYPGVPPNRALSETMFFSRRIQDPRFGIRVTGKEGAWMYGGLVASDEISSPDPSHATATAAVARAQREFGGQSTVGLFVTSRTTSADANQVGAADLRWKLTPNLVFAGQAMSSRTRNVNRTISEGTAYHAALLYTTRNIFATVFYADRSPAFRADLGFVPRTDIRQIEHYGEYRWRPRSGPVVAYGPNSFVRLNWDHQGRLQEWIVRWPFQIDLKGRTSVFVRRVESYELFAGVDLREHLQTINVTTEWLKWLAINENVEWGRTPNYFPTSGMAPFVADSLSGSLGLTVRPTPRLRYEQTLLYSGLRAHSVGAPGSPPAIFDNTIVRSTLNYQFSRPLSLRTILDYSAVVPNPSLVQLTRDKKIGIDVLVTYQLGPSTALYAGYNSALANVRRADTADPVALTEGAGTLVGRQAVVKLSYLFRM